MAKKSITKKKKVSKKHAPARGGSASGGKKLVAKRAPAKKKAKKVSHTKKRSKKQVVRAAVRGAKAKANSQKALSAETLIEKGKERGYVTYSEILKSFPHVEDDVSFLESLYARFAIAGVDVLEGGMLEEAADEYLATRNIKDRHSTGYDSIQIYLREIGQYPLLTAAEERELAKRIEKSDAEARNILARSNLRLVVSIAKKYVGR